MMIYKGKGILVPLFLIVSIIGTVSLSGIIKRNIGSFNDIDLSFKYILAIGFLLAGIWTWYAKDTYIKKDGVKIILEEEINSFFFIKMKYWAHIFFIIAICFLIDEVVFGRLV